MDNFIITTGGRRVELQPVAQRDIEKAVAVVDREFKARDEPIEPPWYWSVEPDENGEGGEKVFWDAASVAKDGTEEEKQAWAKHQDATSRLEAAKEQRVKEVILLKGIKNEADKMPTPEWVKEQEYWGIELSTDPRKLALEYIESEVLKTPLDLQEVTAKIALFNIKGVVPDEEIASYEASFRASMAAKVKLIFGQGVGGTKNDNGQSGTEQVGDMDLSGQETGNGRGPVLGTPVSEPMGQSEPGR